jgi:CubicO group peptidase (beta-lactamase class C family)
MTGPWRSNGAWSNDGSDPMFMFPEMNHVQLIEWTLRNRPLDFSPGTTFAYSNFGYCVLGRVIEKITGQPYLDYVRDTVLKPCGVNDMTIAGNTRAERHNGEVSYYDEDGDPYGLNVTRMDAHGGWLARPADIVRFLMHVSSFTPPSNILKPGTIKSMTSASAANRGYAKGWFVNHARNWWHIGSLPGTSTIAARIHNGFCWAAFVNTRRLGSSLDADLDQLIWNIVGQVKSWHI